MPQPDGPTSDVKLPLSGVKEIPGSASTPATPRPPPYDFVTDSAITRAPITLILHMMPVSG